MDWIKLAARPAYYLDGALLRAGEAAEVLFLRGLAYCGSVESGGVIDKAALPMIAPRWQQRSSALVREGLWLDEGDHFRVRSWDLHQDVHDAVALRRSNDRERQRRRRQKAVELMRDEMSRDESQGQSRDVSRDVTHLEREREREEEQRTTSSVPRKRERATTSGPFDAFWTSYPRKIGKQAARIAYARAVQRGATADDLLAGATRFADDPTRDPAFTPHPATWLNQGRWEDEGPARPASTTANSSDQRNANHLALVARFAANDAYQPELGA